MKHEIRRIPAGMKPGRRELNEASLRVSYSDAVPEAMREQVREITHLYVPAEHRGRRLATALMNFVCQEADANKVTLILTADPAEDSIPEDALVRWYKKFGFTHLQETIKGTMLARRVYEKPRIVSVPTVGAEIRQIIASLN